MFDIDGKPFSRDVQRQAEVCGLHPVIGFYPHPYNGHGYALLQCGHQVRVEKPELTEEETRDGLACNYCVPKSSESSKKEWQSAGEAPPRKVIEIEVKGKRYRGKLECGHFIFGYQSKVRMGRVVRCLKCRDGR